MKTLITGALGFTAKHLIELLGNKPETKLYLSDRITGSYQDLLVCDLTQKESVEELIANIRPDNIYHLAGSFTNNYDIDYATNVLSTKNILDSMLKCSIQGRVLLVGSAAEYGIIEPNDNPVSEDHPLKPCRVHGLCKVYQTHLMNFYCKVHKMDIVMARTFNLYGDNRRISKLLFIGNVCEQIEKVKSGQVSKISVGNLDAKRDYIDVRDAVKYYRKIMELGKSGEVYNVGSGRCIKMRDILKQILEEAGLAMEVVNKPVFAPDKTDVPEICADLRKIRGL